MTNSFARHFWLRILHGRGRVTGAIALLLVLIASVFSAWQAIPLIVVLGILDVLFYAGLVLLSWRTVGQALTTPDERAQMSAEARVDCAFNCWALPARRSKT